MLQIGSLPIIDFSNISVGRTIIKMPINKFPLVRFWLILDIMSTDIILTTYNKKNRALQFALGSSKFRAKLPGLLGEIVYIHFGFTILIKADSINRFIVQKFQTNALNQ